MTQFKPTPLLLSILLTSVSSIQAFAIARGPGSDGGSCSVSIGSRSQLKDFIRAGAQTRALAGPQKPDSNLSLTMSGQWHGFEILNGVDGSQNFQTNPAFTTALSLVNQWRKDSPEIAELVAQAMGVIRFAATSRIYRPTAFGCTDANDIPVVIYSGTSVAAVISVPTWNRLNIESQTGAVIKESLRLLQFEDSDGSLRGLAMSENSEKLLSTIVATMVFSTPQAGARTLDRQFTNFGAAGPASNPALLKLTSDLNRVCEIAASTVNQIAKNGPAAKANHQNFLISMNECAHLKIVGPNPISEQLIKATNFADEISNLAMQIYNESPALRSQMIQLTKNANDMRDELDSFQIHEDLSSPIISSAVRILRGDSK